MGVEERWYFHEINCKCSECEWHRTYRYFYKRTDDIKYNQENYMGWFVNNVMVFKKP